MQILTVEKDLHATHVSFWFLCVTFHDLVKLKIFLYGSHLGGYAFYGVLGWLNMWMGDLGGQAELSEDIRLASGTGRVGTGLYRKCDTTSCSFSSSVDFLG